MVDSATSGCGLIFIGCDGLMLVGGGSCGLILVVGLIIRLILVCECGGLWVSCGNGTVVVAAIRWLW